MHADHCLGIVPLMGKVMYSGCRTSTSGLRLELYGPPGLRRLIRTTLEITELNLEGKYAVHELLAPGDVPFPTGPEDLHPNESKGRDVVCDEQGYWRGFLEAEGLQVDAGPIMHRSYVFRESPQRAAVDPDAMLGPINDNRQALIDSGI
ncbi:hypothetical protein FRB99_004680, partial [Tulasnella sp. 403]